RPGRRELELEVAPALAVRGRADREELEGLRAARVSRRILGAATRSLDEGRAGLARRREEVLGHSPDYRSRGARRARIPEPRTCATGATCRPASAPAPRRMPR